MSVNFIWYLAKNNNKNQITHEKILERNPLHWMCTHTWVPFKVEQANSQCMRYFYAKFSTVSIWPLARQFILASGFFFIQFHIYILFFFKIPIWRRPFSLILSILFAIWTEFSWCLFQFFRSLRLHWTWSALWICFSALPKYVKKFEWLALHHMNSTV